MTRGKYSWLDLAIWVVALALLAPFLTDMASQALELVTILMETRCPPQLSLF